jgi:HK97 family phage major capsid protein
MRALHDLGAAEDQHSRARDFIKVAHALALYRGKALPDDLSALGLSPRAAAVAKAAVTAGGAGGGWASNLVESQQVAAGFMDLLRHRSVFYSIVGDVVRLPFNVRIGTVATGAGAAVVGPGQPIVTARMDFGNSSLERRKAGAIVVLSDQLIRAIGVGERLIGQSLRDSVAEAVDQDVINNILLVGVTPTAATTAPLTDLRTLLNAVAPAEGSRLHWAAHPGVAIRLATADATPSTGGPPVFPTVTPTGGQLLGFPLVVSSKIPSGMLLLIDASRLAGNADTITLQASSEADVEMQSAPTQSMGSGSPVAPTGVSKVSLFQTNCTGVMATAYYGLVKAQPNAVAAISGITGW